MIIKTVWLYQVDDVKSVKFSSLCVCYSEIVPLSIASCVVIWFQNQVVFVLIDLNSSSKIARFKSRFKQQGHVISAYRYVKLRHLAF